MQYTVTQTFRNTAVTYAKQKDVETPEYKVEFYIYRQVKAIKSTLD